jgi:hypothetical protein
MLDRALSSPFDGQNPSPSSLSTAYPSHVLSCHPRDLFPRYALIGLACGTTDITMSIEWDTERQQLYAARRLQDGPQRPDAVGTRIEWPY